MVKHTQTIRRQIGDELLESTWPFCGGWCLKSYFSVMKGVLFPLIVFLIEKCNSLHNSISCVVQLIDFN